MPTPEALAYLEHHSWPGNVRELRNVIRKALLLSRGYPLTRDTVAAALTQTVPYRSSGDQTLAGYVSELLGKAQRGEATNIHVLVSEAVERELYSQAIRQAGGDQSKAANWLGVSRPTIRERLIKYGLHPSHSKTDDGHTPGAD
jgi:DNA-binding NtrC family response regulator